MKLNKIIEKVIGCAFRVYNKMGFGYLESVYEKCMRIELEKIGLKSESQKQIRVYYDDLLVGEFVADLVVEDLLVVELKSVKRILKAHELQLINHLTSTGKPAGLIINFGELKVDVKRKVKDFKKMNRIKKRVYL
jgi:GxxExxY protein